MLYSPADRRARAGSRLMALGTVVAALLGLAACSPTAPTTSPVASAPATSAVATPSPTEVAATPSAQPTEGPVVTAVTATCTAADVKVSHGLVEGAAGSRITSLVLEAGSACSIDASPALGLRDSTGAAILGAASSGPGRIDLKSGAAYGSNARLANWCAAEPSFPVTLILVLGDDEVRMDGGSFPDEGDLPPCNDGSGPTLEATAWIAQP